MSIKGTTKELFVRKDQITIMGLLGNSMDFSYSELKRVDYCYAKGFQSGYITLVSGNNKSNKFEFGAKVNDNIAQTISYIQSVRADLEVVEYQPGQKRRDRIIEITATFGYKELGLKSEKITITQESSGKVYFNKDNSVFYTLQNYEWDGPEFDQVTRSQSSTDSSSKTVKKGKSLKIGAGAVLGGIVAGPIGAAVGTAMGAGGKGKSKTSGSSSTNSTQTSSNVEKNTNATITVKNLDTQKTYKISFRCNRDLDVQIRCFDFEEKTSGLEENVKEATTSLEGIKALKELLDMGAITQEEFEIKKRKILDL